MVLLGSGLAALACSACLWGGYLYSHPQIPNGIYSIYISAKFGPVHAYVSRRESDELSITRFIGLSFIVITIFTLEFRYHNISNGFTWSQRLGLIAAVACGAGLCVVWFGGYQLFNLLAALRLESLG
jgi:hypothetical protein